MFLIPGKSMIAGIGIDIVSVKRIERTYFRFGRRFLEHFLGNAELALLAEKPSPAFLAGRFAAKEAAVKALGTGFQFGIVPQMIQVLRLESGAPELHLSDRAFTRARQLGAGHFFVSISHEKETAIAMVILEGE